MSKLSIPVLYEDAEYIVINKPAGLVVHADGRTTEPTVVDWILDVHPEMKEVGEPLVVRPGQENELTIYRPGIVHRIDRDTSGVLVIAKTQSAFEFLKDQFQDREVEKTYNTFVFTEVPEDEGMVDRPIGRNKKDFRLWSAQRGARGEMRDAVTHYKVLKRGNGFSFIEAKPRTGRTHQIRVHFKAVNFPIVADPLYAPKREKALGFDRLALHARAISFKNREGKTITVEAPLPEDFQKALKMLD
ncbi:MAG: RluA family pseudouridine synthase [Patescibacteria group bacterium]